MDPALPLGQLPHLGTVSAGAGTPDRIGDLLIGGVDSPAGSPRAARDRAPGGSGIGLTIARALITAHHSTLTAISSGPCVGARFTITLPRVAGSR